MKRITRTKNSYAIINKNIVCLRLVVVTIIDQRIRRNNLYYILEVKYFFFFLDGGILRQTKKRAQNRQIDAKEAAKYIFDIPEDML